MKKIKILSLVLVVALSMCVAFALGTTSSAAATKVTASSFVQNGLGLELGKDYDYSFAVVGDTQCLNYYQDVTNGTKYMDGLYQWIIDNQSSKNIQFVMGLGDITQTYQSSTNENSAYLKEWNNAKEAIALLDQAGIPYSLVRGNHDITTGLNSFFGEGNDYYNTLLELEAQGKAGIFEKGKIENTWRKIEIGSDKYLILTFDWFPTEEAMYWAENVINANPDYKVIATTHHFMGGDGTFSDDIDSTFPSDQIGDAKWGEAVSGGFVAPRILWEEVLSKYANVEMILCGHVDLDDIQVTQLYGENGNTVTCMLIDPQTIDQTIPVGMVAMLYFKENGDIVNVEYISTVRANDGDDSTYEYLKDINQFSVKLEYSDGWTKTDYGYLPTEAYESGTFHMFVDDDGDPTNENFYLGSYDRWVNDDKTGGAYIAAKQHYEKGGITVRRNKSLFVLMSKSYDGHNDAGYNGANAIAGALTLDLGGNEYTVGNNPILYVYATTTDRVSRINLVNGQVKLSGWNPMLVVGTDKGIGGASEIKLANLDVYFDEDGTGTKDTPIIHTNGGGKATSSTTNITITDCDFNLKDYAPNKKITMLNTAESYVNNHAAIVVNGGSIKAASSDKFVLFAGNSGSDSVALGKGTDGNYTSLVLGESTTLSTIYNTTAKNDDGETVRAKFVGAAEPNEDGTYSYTLTETTETDGKFDVSSETAVFVNFDSNGTRKTTHTTWDGAINATNTSDGRVLVMTKDYAIEKKKSITNLSGSLVIDLNGHTLTIPSNISGMMNGYFNDDSKNGASLHITFKNGTIKNEYTDSLIQFEYGASNAMQITRDFTFENINFEGTNQIFAAWDKLSSTETTVGTRTTAIFNNCTFNYTSGKMIFPLDSLSKSGNYKCVFNVTVNGGKFVSETPITANDISSKNTVADYTDTFVFGKYNGEYPSFYVKTGSTTGASASTFTALNGLALSAFKLFETVDIGGVTYNVYQVADVTGYVTTDYGIIPPAYTDAEKYPFVMFKNGSVYKAGTDWYSSSESGIIKDAVAQATKNNGVTILLRRDYMHDSTKMYNGFSNVKGTLTVDLGGFTMKHNREIMKFNQKSSDTITVNIKNGSLITVARRMLGFGTYNASANEVLNLTFTNVYIGFESIDGTDQYSSLFGTDAAAAYVGGYATANVVFNNCTIDLTNLVMAEGTTQYTVFTCNTDTATHAIHVTLNGGEIIASQKYSLKIAALKIYEEIEDADTVRFTNDGGRYTKITMPLGVSAPSFDYVTASGNKASAVKWNDNEMLGTTTYIIREKTLVSFTPKTSITLSNALIYNVYVPVCDELKSFTLDGVKYTDLSTIVSKIVDVNGEKYYLFAIELPSAEAARDVILKATVTVDGKDYTGSWTMSIPKYAKKVIETSESDLEKTLVKDVLAYIQSAYNYFVDYNTEEEIMRVTALIDEILVMGGDYDGTPTISGETSKDQSGMVTDVTLNLDYKPTIRFYVTDTNVEFKIGNEVLKTVKDIDGAYVELDVNAYVLAETITFGDGGSYHISTYLEGAFGQDHENLVACFVKYVESAADYRDSVIGAEN